MAAPKPSNAIERLAVQVADALKKRELLLQKINEQEESAPPSCRVERRKASSCVTYFSQSIEDQETSKNIKTQAITNHFEKIKERKRELKDKALREAQQILDSEIERAKKSFEKKQIEIEEYYFNLEDKARARMERDLTELNTKTDVAIRMYIKKREEAQKRLEEVMGTKSQTLLTLEAQLRAVDKELKDLREVEEMNKQQLAEHEEREKKAWRRKPREVIPEEEEIKEMPKPKQQEVDLEELNEYERMREEAIREHEEKERRKELEAQRQHTDAEEEEEDEWDCEGMTDANKLKYLKSQIKAGKTPPPEFLAWMEEKESESVSLKVEEKEREDETKKSGYLDKQKTSLYPLNGEPFVAPSSQPETQSFPPIIMTTKVKKPIRRPLPRKEE